MKKASYAARINDLRQMGLDDGYDVNKDSEADFWRFTRLTPNLRRGELVLSESGTLRLEYDDECGSRIGIEFLGNDSIQYVIFTSLNRDAPESIVGGRDSLLGLRRQIDAFGLRHLIYE